MWGRIFYRENHVMEKLLTREEAANVLGLSPATLAAWHSRGPHILPEVKIGRSVRYRKLDLQQLIASRLTGPVCGQL